MHRSTARACQIRPPARTETYLWSICTCRNTSRRRTCASDTFCRRSSRPARAPCTIRRRSCHGIALETHTDRRRWRVGEQWRVSTYTSSSSSSLIIIYFAPSQSFDFVCGDTRDIDNMSYTARCVVYYKTLYI